MTHYAVHLNDLNQDPAKRMGEHGRAALEEASGLFAWLPYGDAATQAGALVHATASNKRKDQAAIAAWAGLVRGHALDFHADAGRAGTHWQYAVADAWETWLLLREGQLGANQWPWQMGIAQFTARGQQGEAAWVDPEQMHFGGGQEAWKRADMSDWRRGVARLPDEQACLDAQHLAQAWARVDLPTLALAVGALWAVAMPGWVMGARQLEMGGARGGDNLVITDWN